jgi:hypothetical protein
MREFVASKYRRRLPKALRDIGCRERTLYDTFRRALAITSTMDAERHAILCYAFSHVFEVPQPKFEFALRRYKRRATLEAAAREFEQLSQRAVDRRPPDP